MWKGREPVDHGFVGPLNPSPDGRPKPKPWVWMKCTLLLCGVALLTVYCAARIEGILRSRAAVKAFDTFDSVRTCLWWGYSVG